MVNRIRGKISLTISPHSTTFTGDKADEYASHVPYPLFSPVPSLPPSFPHAAVWGSRCLVVQKGGGQGSLLSYPFLSFCLSLFHFIFILFRSYLFIPNLMWFAGFTAAPLPCIISAYFSCISLRLRFSPIHFQRCIGIGQGKSERPGRSRPPLPPFLRRQFNPRN